MFNVGVGELLVIGLVALVVLGPDKLPATARKVGNVVAELRRMSAGLQDDLRRQLDPETAAPSGSPPNDDPRSDSTSDERKDATA